MSDRSNRLSDGRLSGRAMLRERGGMWGVVLVTVQRILCRNACVEYTKTIEDNDM